MIEKARPVWFRPGLIHCRRGRDTRSTASGALTHVEQLDHLDDCGGDTGTGAEDGGGTCLVESVVILRRNDTADYHHDVLTAELLELVDDLGHEGL